jgi:hypothetical protein
MQSQFAKPARIAALGCAVAMLSFGWSSAHGVLITFGEATNPWSSIGVNDDVSSSETATIVDDNFTFNLGISFAGDNVGISNNGILTEGGRNSWRNNGTTFAFTLSVVDANATLDLATLSFSSISFTALNSSTEQVTFTESASSGTASFNGVAGSVTVVASDIYPPTEDLTPLALANVGGLGTGTWNMILENTGDNQYEGITSLSIDYTTAAIPEPSTGGLLGLGLIGGLLVSRRRRKR